MKCMSDESRSRPLQSTPASWAHSLTVNPRSTSPLPGYANIAGTAWWTKRYLNIELLKDQMRGAITA
jgi:hypothetical protein